MNRTKVFIIIVYVMTALLLVSCNKHKDSGESAIDYTEPETTVTVVPPTATPEVTQAGTDAADAGHEGELRSYLTGMWIPEEAVLKRPYAIQFNNYKYAASFQSGTSQAGILYEALVEGGITRLLGVSDSYSGDRLGPVRSSRHYFASIVDEYDAIYIHFGKTKYARAKLTALGINNLDGETGIGDTVFYRDKSIKAPHNAFTSVDRILKGIDKKDYKTTYRDSFEPHFSFYEEDTDLTSDTPVNKVTVGYSSYISPYLEYNATDKLYYRYQFGAPHKDTQNGEQLSFKNIIIWFVKESNIDHNGYQTMDFENASGSGYYITNGKMVPITWKKNESKKWMRFYDEAGQELTINPGKTYIALFPDNRTKGVKLE